MVVSSNSVEAIGFFNLLNPSRRTMVLGSTQPLPEISTRNLLEGKTRRCVSLTTSPPFVSRFFMSVSTSHKAMGFHGLLQGSFTFLLTSEQKKKPLFYICGLQSIIYGNYATSPKVAGSRTYEVNF
jgi:hypothetical protein